MIRFLALAMVILLAAPSIADDAKPPVVLEAELGRANGPSGRNSEFLRVRFVGGEKEAVVPTDGFRVKVERRDKKVTVTFELCERKDDKGRVVIPSVDTLGLVKIQSGEVAVVRTSSIVATSQPASAQAVRDALAGEVTLVVQYEVSELLAKRYGLISGKFTATASISK